jgi:hypothetical protein
MKRLRQNLPGDQAFVYTPMLGIHAGTIGHKQLLRPRPYTVEACVST